MFILFLGAENSLGRSEVGYSLQALFEWGFLGGMVPAFAGLVLGIASIVFSNRNPLWGLVGVVLNALVILFDLLAIRLGLEVLM
ncbi:MAG: hypothetical protein JW809_01560 [Pirellulales bacterium]|nr:hypothetical protein [Pirellulales bacterium]